MSGIARGGREFQMRGSFGHAHEVFEVFIPLPLLLIERRQFAAAAFLDQFGDAGRQAGRGPQIQNFFRRGQCGERFENVGGAVKSGLTTRIKLAEAQFEYPRELLLPGAEL